MYHIIQNKKFIIFLVLTLTVIVPGCEKFLDEKPNKALVVPTSITDLQALLDNNGIMNTQNTGVGEASADNYYLTDANWASLDDASRNMYIWGEEIVFQTIPDPWKTLYSPVYYSNTVLDLIDDVAKTENNIIAWNNVKGSALFYRAKSYLILSTTFVKAYDPTTSTSDLGIPLRVNSDFNVVSVRSSVEQSYNQIINDLKASIPLLPVTPNHVMRPSKPAAYGLLSRTYLAMRQYDKAELYADSCLQLFNALLDYNVLTASASYPIAAFNKEVIFNTNGNVTPIGNVRAKIDPNLYLSYASNDLRKTVFFLKNTDGSYRFKGSYFGSSSLFTGIAADELYLTKAECLARKGNTSESMDALNQLMIKRFDKASFVPFSANTAEVALIIVLNERRKELLMRDLRWMDLKRLNKEPNHEVIVKRNLNGQLYQLIPNENRYALPIPKAVIDLTGMQQNQR